VIIYRPTLTQGITYDGKYYYGISSTGLYKYDANWNLIATNGNAAAQCGGNHMGGGSIYNGVLYVPCTADPPAQPLAHVGLFSASTLSFIKVVDLAGAGLPFFPPTAVQINIAAVAVNPDAGLLAVCSFGPAGSTAKTGASVFTYNLTTFAYKGSFQASGNPTIYNQGISYYNGHYYYAYDNPPVGSASSVNGGVAIMNTDGSSARQIIPASRMMAGGGTDEIEGLCVTNGNIYVLRGDYLYMFPV
jgi:hypothetical protein